jgi:hypothetical protein
MIFKKHITVLIAFLFLVSNLGLAFNVHYCDDEIASISLNNYSDIQEIEEDCCGEVEKDSQCCDNKIIKLQDKSDQVIVNSLSFDADLFFVSEQLSNLFFLAEPNFKKKELISYSCNANAPPLYQLYSQYIFYA